jgi:hypothetical protein
MGADQLAEIAPMVREVMAGGDSWCATFEVSGDSSRWVQFMVGTINAAYPRMNDECVKAFGACDVVDWAPLNFVTVEIERSEARTIAMWIDRYFAEILDCNGECSIDCRIEKLRP